MKAPGREEGPRPDAGGRRPEGSGPTGLWADRTGARGTARDTAARSLATLSEEARIILALLCLEGLTEAEIAETLETSERRVRRIAEEARRRLRASVAGLGADA